MRVLVGLLLALTCFAQDGRVILDALRSAGWTKAKPSARKLPDGRILLSLTDYYEKTGDLEVLGDVVGVWDGKAYVSGALVERTPAGRLLAACYWGQSIP